MPTATSKFCMRSPSVPPQKSGSQRPNQSSVAPIGSRAVPSSKLGPGGSVPTRARQLHKIFLDSFSELRLTEPPGTEAPTPWRRWVELPTNPSKRTPMIVFGFFIKVDGFQWLRPVFIIPGPSMLPGCLWLVGVCGVLWRGVGAWGSAKCLQECSLTVSDLTEYTEATGVLPPRSRQEQLPGCSGLGSQETWLGPQKTLRPSGNKLGIFRCKPTKTDQLGPPAVPFCPFWGRVPLLKYTTEKKNRIPLFILILTSLLEDLVNLPGASSSWEGVACGPKRIKLRWRAPRP